MISIDYLKLGFSQSFYSNNGFKVIDAPWWATEEIIKLTYSGDLSYHLKESNKFLVGSGEQSFLYLLSKGLLPQGKYQTITPCFRYEAQDALHRKGFMKNELIDTQNVREQALEEMIYSAKSFFSYYVASDKLEVIRTCDANSEISYDIVCSGIELGSYGIRRIKYFEWMYGTGCAEPRLSAVISSLKIIDS